LIAINPYQSMNLYDRKYIEKYHNTHAHANNDPHIFVREKKKTNMNEINNMNERNTHE